MGALVKNGLGGPLPTTAIGLAYAKVGGRYRDAVARYPVPAVEVEDVLPLLPLPPLQARPLPLRAARAPFPPPAAENALSLGSIFDFLRRSSLDGLDSVCFLFFLFFSCISSNRASMTPREGKKYIVSCFFV